MATLAPLRIKCLHQDEYNLEQAVELVNEFAPDSKDLDKELDDNCQQSYGWSLLTDACLHRDVITRQPARLSDVHCPFNMPELHPMLMRVLVSPSVPTVGIPMAHIIRKLLPRGSAARTFHTVVKPYILKSPLVAMTVNKMLVCSLIGNYPHSQNRMAMKSRKKVYEWFHPQAAKNDLSTFAKYVGSYKFMARFHRVYIHLLRDYIIYLLEDDPVARKHFDAKYDYKSFKAITQSAVEWIRKYIEDNHDDMEPGPKLNIAFDTELNRIHARMLRIQTRAKQPPFFQFLGQIRGHAPIRIDRIHRQIDDSDIKVKIEPIDHTYDDADDIENETEQQREKREQAQEENEANHDDAMLDIIESGGSIEKLIAALTLENTEESHDSKRAKKVKPDAPRNRRDVRLTKQGLPLAASRFVYELMRKYHGPVDDILRVFLKDNAILLGADANAITELHRIWQVYSEERTPSSTIRDQLYHFSNAFPYTWAMICTAWTAYNAAVGMKLYRLDYNTMRNQLNAICARFNCVGHPEQVPPAAFKMSICLGCQTPKSWVKDPLRATSKETYSFGLKDSSIDLYTGKAYCRSSKSCGPYKCGVQEIMHINLLGHVLPYRGRLYAFCPQPEGGHLAVLNPAHSKSNEFTLSCYACTLEQERVALTKAVTDHPYGPKAINKCVVCDKRAVKLANKFVYAEGVVMCQKCNKDSVLQHLTRTLPLDVIENRMISEEAAKKIREAILKHRKDVKENWKGHNKAKNQAALKHAKKIQWAKSRN